MSELKNLFFTNKHSTFARFSATETIYNEESCPGRRPSKTLPEETTRCWTKSYQRAQAIRAISSKYRYVWNDSGISGDYLVFPEFMGKEKKTESY